jgi:SAM-dependent methyltransferase
VSDEKGTAAILRIRACPCCSSEQLRTRFEVRHIMDDPLFAWAQRAEYARASIQRCRECGFVFKGEQPGPGLLEGHYAESGEDYQQRLAEDEPEFRSDYRHARRFLRERFPEGGSVLDVGCSRGFFLRSLGKAWQLYGVEPSRSAADYAARQHGIRVHAGSLFSAAYAGSSFDAVTVFDVVEHLPDPPRLLAEVRRILKPGGWLVIGTGNCDAVTARLAGSKWAYLAIPDHLSFFGQRSLRRALVAAGFSRVLLRGLHHGEMSHPVWTGWLRAVIRHRAITMFGPGITRLPVFRSKTGPLPVPYFWDHILCLAS